VNTRLTLRLDDELIARAKRHSAETGRSVSQLVADFFTLIEA
jgi:antitoxin component of RelBE/YafQ-DinJ toxin-antitoxin module